MSQSYEIAQNKIKKSHLIRLFKDAPVMESLMDFQQKNKLAFATISAIGAVKDADIGFYHLHSKTYDHKIVKEDTELISLLGNLTWKDNAPIAHCHIAMGCEDFKVIGGHLFEAKVAVTVECWIHEYEASLQRAFDDSIGLNAWQMHTCKL